MKKQLLTLLTAGSFFIGSFSLAGGPEIDNKIAPTVFVVAFTGGLIISPFFISGLTLGLRPYAREAIMAAGPEAYAYVFKVQQKLFLLI